MAVITEFVLRSPELPLVRLPDLLEADAVACSHALCLGTDTPMFLVHLDPDEDVTAEDLGKLEEVTDVAFMGRSTDAVIYKLTVVLTEAVDRAFDAKRFPGAQLEATTISSRGWHERKLWKDPEIFRGFRANCEANGITMDVLSVRSDPPTTGGNGLHGLTERQHEALTLALSRGYYDSPRRVSTQELADTLGISQPSASNLLRRAERQLLTDTLDAKGVLSALSG